MKNLLMFYFLTFLTSSLSACCVKDFLEKPIVQDFNNKINPFSLGSQSADLVQQAIQKDPLFCCISKDCTRAVATTGQAVIVGFCTDKILGYNHHETCINALQLACAGYTCRSIQITYDKWCLHTKNKPEMDEDKKTN